MKKLISLLLTLALLAGCVSLAAAETADDPVLLTVDGAEIRLSDVQPAYDYFIAFYEDYGYDMDNDDARAAARDFAARETVWTLLIKRSAAENGLDVFTEEEEAQMAADNDAMWEEAIAEYIMYAAGVTDPSTLTEEEASTLRANAIAYYEAGGFTRESTLQDERDRYISERVKAAALEGEDIDVTEEDIAAHHAALAEETRAMLYDGATGYEMTPAELYSMYDYLGYDLYYVPAGFRMVKSILLTPDQSALSDWQNIAARWEEQAEAAESGETADEALAYEQVEAARLAVVESVRPTLDAIDAAMEEGASFEDMMTRYSVETDMAGNPAGTEGFLLSEESLIHDAAFISAAFSLETAGEISDPVVTSDGVYLIQLVGEMPEGPVPMTAAMHDAYLETLTADAEDAAFTAVMNHWIAEADIVYTEAGEPWRMLPEEETAPVD